MLNRAFSFLGIYPREMKTCWHKNLSGVFSIIRKGQKEGTNPTDEWINKTWSIHTMNYYSAIERNASLTHAVTWTHLENMMLSKKKPDTNGQIL